MLNVQKEILEFIELLDRASRMEIFIPGAFLHLFSTSSNNDDIKTHHKKYPCNCRYFKGNVADLVFLVPCMCKGFQK